MPINPDALGDRAEPVRRSWSSTDSLLYAVGVGAGHEPIDPRDLPFTTENSAGIAQRALPTMPVVLADPIPALANIGSFDPTMLVHGEERVVCHRELPPEGEVEVVSHISAIWDKGKGAVVEVTSSAADIADGEPVFDVVMSSFIRGEGGFGGERGPSAEPLSLDGAPDHVVEQPTRPEQALLYRLNGDRNPLHSDPTFAALGGFDRPILHGLCTYGFAGRALLHELCDSDPARFRSVYGRFSSPVIPGETLRTEIWVGTAGEATFRVLASGDRVVIDAGRCTYDV